MPAKKKSTPKPSEPRRFRVLKAFGFEGVYYARHNERQVAELPAFEIEDRVKRGFIVELRNRAAPSTAEPEE